MSDSFHFPLEQGWAKGLEISFLNLRDSMALDTSCCVSLKQTHSAEIIDWQQAGQTVEGDGILASGAAFKENRKPLLIKTADCMPLVYIDRENECVVLMHAGWRGLQQGIHRKPFEEGFCDPKYTWIWLGPCLNGSSFQVKEDMWSQFGADASNPSFFEDCVEEPGTKFFQAWDFVEQQCRDFGVELFYNVETDTFLDKSFVSWRRAKKAGAEKLKVQNYTTVVFRK